MSILKEIAEGRALLEVSKSLLGRYINKAASDATDAAATEVQAHEWDDGDSASDNNKRMNKRLKGITKATKKLTKEDVEQIDEISGELKTNYAIKASSSKQEHMAKAASSLARGNASKGEPEVREKLKKQGADHLRKAQNRDAGIKRATGGLKEEDMLASLEANIAEEIAEGRALLEVSKALAHRYLKRAADSSITNVHGKSINNHAKGVRDGVYNYEDNPSLSKSGSKEYTDKHVRKVMNRAHGIKRAAKILTKEEKELVESKGEKFHRFYCNPLEHADSHREDTGLLASLEANIAEEHAKRGRGRPRKPRHEDGKVVNDPEANL